MTTVKGIDVAWARPSVAQIKGAGAQFVCRYFSGDASKNLHADEVTAYRAAGLGTVVVWETTAGRATAGTAAGVADAKAAEAQRKAVGLPADMPLYFAVDVDTGWSSVQSYFDGVISVLGVARTGCYGGVKVINGAYGHGLRYLWQTVAWSGGVWSAHATIQQRGGTVLGGTADLDYATVADYGQYPRPNTPQEDPMAGITKQDIFEAVWNTDKLPRLPDVPDFKTNPTWAPQTYLRDIDNRIRAMQTREAAQTAAIAKLASLVGSGVDTATVVAAVQKAIADEVVDVNVSIDSGSPAVTG